MTTRIDDALAVAGGSQDFVFSARQVIDTIQNNSGRSAPRTAMPCSYWSSSASPTVYFTALRSNGSVLTSRTTSGITLSSGYYHYSQALEPGMTTFTAIWDEGSPSDYIPEQIVVDT